MLFLRIATNAARLRPSGYNRREVATSHSPDTLPHLPDTFTYREALATGLTEHHVRRRVAEGRLERVATGIYRRAESLSTEEDFAEEP